MQKDDEFIANRLIWKAGKYTLTEHFSLFFKGLTKETQQYLEARIDTTKSGIPVLFFTKPTNEWTLICTRQVIGYNNHEIICIDLSNIKSVSQTAFKRYSNNKITYQQAKKSEWDEVEIEDRKGNKYVFHAYKGTDLFALWNILLMAIRIYR
jgi:hypothetical protein